MKDITREEVQNEGKKNALNIIKSALELAGLDPADYDLNLRKKASPKAAPNIQVFQTAAYLAATCLSPSANKILMYFLSMSEFENYVGMDQRSLHEELNMSLSTVEKSIKELSENGIILKTKHPSDKRRNDYFLNPMSAWKGKTLNRKIALAILHKENDNQLHLFGETYSEGVIREAQEIKAKRGNLHIATSKEEVEQPKRVNLFKKLMVEKNSIIDVPDSDYDSIA